MEIFDLMPGTVLENPLPAQDTARAFDEAASLPPPPKRSSLVGVPDKIAARRRESSHPNSFPDGLIAKMWETAVIWTGCYDLVE